MNLELLVRERKKLRLYKWSNKRMNYRERLKNKKRIVIKIGSSSLTHAVSGDLNLQKIEKLVRIISDLKGQGKEVVLVSSGAIATGRQALHHPGKPESRPGQADDGVPAVICGVQSGGGPGSDDQGYHDQRCLPLQCQKHL